MEDVSKSYKDSNQNDENKQIYQDFHVCYWVWDQVLQLKKYENS